MRKSTSVLIEAEKDVSLQIAPMVNLMFVLLVVFTLAAGEKIIEHELGVQVSSGEGPTVPGTPINIFIHKDGSVLFNRTPMGDKTDTELLSLKDRLKRLVEIDENQTVVIRPAPDTKHQRVVDILNACSYAGVKKLSFGG